MNLTFAERRSAAKRVDGKMFIEPIIYEVTERELRRACDQKKRYYREMVHQNRILMENLPFDDYRYKLWSKENENFSEKSNTISNLMLRPDRYIRFHNEHIGERDSHPSMTPIHLLDFNETSFISWKDEIVLIAG